LPGLRDRLADLLAWYREVHALDTLRTGLEGTTLLLGATVPVDAEGLFEPLRLVHLCDLMDDRSGSLIRQAHLIQAGLPWERPVPDATPPAGQWDLERMWDLGPYCARSDDAPTA